MGVHCFLTKRSRPFFIGIIDIHYMAADYLLDRHAGINANGHIKSKGIGNSLCLIGHINASSLVFLSPVNRAPTAAGATNWSCPLTGSNS